MYVGGLLAEKATSNDQLIDPSELSVSLVLHIGVRITSKGI